MRIFVITVAFLLTATSAQAEMIRVFLKEIDCIKCARVIERDFKRLPVVKNAQVDMPSKSVTLETEGEGTLSNRTIYATLADIGYDATGVVRKK